MPSLSLKIVQDEGAVTRKVKFDTRMTIKEAHKLVKEKVIVPNDGKEYGLFLRSADDEKTGVWLEDDKTLDYYMLRDGDSLDYLCKVRNLRVRLLDDTVKTVQVDESKSVGELMFTICARVGITNYDEYGLCHEEEEETEEGKDSKDGKEPVPGSQTLKRKMPKERDVALEQLSKKLKTDDNVDWLDQHRTLREQGVDPTETLLLKRRLFFSDRNVDSRDPVQLNLLYVQIKDAILIGRHPVTEQQASDCKIRWINIRDVHRRILKKNSMELPNPPKMYKYDRYLSFMKPFYKDLVVSTLEEDDEEQSQDWNESIEVKSDEEPPCSDDSDVVLVKRTKTKRKRPKRKSKEPSFEEVNQTMPSFSEMSTVSTSELDPTDSVDAFLLSIGSTLKTFSPYHLNIAKSKIFSIVQNHDLQQIVEKQQQNPDVKVSTTDSILIG